MTFLVFNISSNKWYVSVLDQDLWLSSDGTLVNDCSKSIRKSKRDAIRMLKKYYKVRHLNKGFGNYKWFEAI